MQPDRDPWHSEDRGGRGADVDALFDLTYAELRRLASSVKRGDPSVTLNPTALVHEAWLKLRRSPELAATSTLHFKRIAARAMRQVLVEAARRRNASKRGGSDGTVFVTFDEQFDRPASDADDLLRLDEALRDLARMQPRQAALVESRFFGGLAIEETAALLNVSEATVLRDWRAAKAWLGTQLRGER
jgi:RNA polymerase sigma-70 factor, ECF subfamily